MLARGGFKISEKEGLELASFSKFYTLTQTYFLGVSDLPCKRPFLVFSAIKNKRSKKTGRKVHSKKLQRMLRDFYAPDE